MRPLKSNLLLGFALACVPLGAEAVSAWFGHPPGAGVKALLYWPFDLALLGLAGLLFVAVNYFSPAAAARNLAVATLIGGAATAAWFCAAFLITFQVHLFRGGVP